MAAAQNLSSMSEAQLRNVLFGEKPMSFFEETSAYMQAMATTEADQTKKNTESMNIETKTQDALTFQTKIESDKYVEELHEQAEMASSMPGWLSDILSAFTVLVAIATGNPALIAMAVTSFTLQVSGAQEKMMQAACGNDPTKRALFSFGFALGEAFAGGAAGAAADGAAASKASVDGAEVATKTTSQLMKNFAKYSLTYLGQALMLDNFWPEFFEGPCKMSESNAAIAGICVGMGFGVASTAVAATNEDGLTLAVKNAMSKMSDKTQYMIRLMGKALAIMGDGFQIGSGISTINTSGKMKELANFEKDVMALTMAKLSLSQSLSTQVTSMLTQTQDLSKTLTDDSVAINQTFSSFAEMFRQAQ